MVIDKKLAKSDNQKHVIEQLEKFGVAVFKKDYLVSQTHYTSYSESWLNLYKRLKDAGYPVKYIPGKRGGVWTSKIVLLSGSK